ncbi:DUF5011 domain-containing protein [Holzapfeliella sp. He02]|uniref:DUF5011 domain-containing protein n=1 Tax=Holzapfeliella saturejae TaxID=3082953 RepID=A0ABU8SF41_9LACO
MKKSSIKYFGVTAAALLAVAPMAAQTVSSSQGNTVAAAALTDSTIKDQVVKSVNALPATATFGAGDTDRSTVYNALTSPYKNFNGNFTDNNDSGNDFIKAISNPNWKMSNAGQDGLNNVTYSVTAANGWSAQDVVNSIAANTTNNTPYAFNFTIKALDADQNVVASKNITVNFTGTVSGNLSSNFSAANAKVNDSTYNYSLAYNAVNDLTLTDGNGNKVAANGVAAGVTNKTGVNSVIDSGSSKFNNYGTATQTLVFTINAKNDVAIDGATQVTESKPVTVGTKTYDGTTAGTGKKMYTITRDVNVYNANVNYQPYFSVKNTSTTDSNSTSVVNNAIVNVPDYASDAKDNTLNGKDKTVSELTNQLNSFLYFNVNDGSHNTIEIAPSSVESAVKNAGGTVKNGNISGLTGIYYLTVTVNSPANNKPATIKVPVNFSNAATSTASPVFQGVNNATVIQGQNFNAYDNVKAYDNGTKSGNDYTAPQIMSGYWTVQNSVNTNVPGDYNVVYSVVNSQGLTTTQTRKVTVLPVNGLGKDQVVNFVPGYGVMVWSATDNSVNATSDFVQHGTTVKTFDTKTVDGVSYTRINSANSNQWVQSKYFDANANNAPQNNNNTNTNTDSNQETPFEGVLTINYVPGYRVFLRDGQANMQQQSVAHGESFKVWAKKTVGNHTYYRIGTDAQWIEDTYAQF